MSATVTIIEKNGAGGTGTNKTSSTIRFKNADNATVDLINPMVKPAALSPSVPDFSFEKWLRMNVTGGSYTQITNGKVYSDGATSFGAGVNSWIKAVLTFATPAEAVSAAGYTNFFTFTSGSPLSLNTGTATGTGEKGDHAVMMMEVTDQATGGVLAAEALTMSWDEI